MKLNKTYGKLYGYYEFSRINIFITDPELIRQIFTKDFNTFPNHRPTYWGEYVKHNLFSIEANDEWRRLRSAMTSSFTSAKLATISDIIRNKTDIMCEILTREAEKGEKSEESNESNTTVHIDYS